MSTFNIPWKFLDLSNEPQNISHEHQKIILEPPKSQKTFAQALSNICDIPLSQIQQPVVKGDRLAIEIPETYYEAGLEACKHNLHGKIIWPKGSTPLSVVALKAKLALVWKNLSTWGVISLGKGFFEFTFSSLEDVRRVRSVPSWNLNPGLLKLFAWSKDFNPKHQHHTSAQVWVRIFGLSQEYWHKIILFTIAGSIGTPICIDSITAKPMHERTFGQFARVLVDIDLLQPLRYKLLVERKGFAFFVDLEYERIPEFCTECKVIGHCLDNCKKWNIPEELRKPAENHLKKKGNVGVKQTYVVITDGNTQRTNPREDNEAANAIINVEEPQLNHMVEAVEKSGSASIGHASPTMQMNAVNDGAILTPLSPSSILREQDRLLEQELNLNEDEEEESSSDESFVNATQVIENINPSVIPGDCQAMVLHKPINPTAGDSSNRLLPDRVVKDMEFLRESWANLAEAEDNATTKDDMIHTADDGFQVQLSKNQKKAQKKKLQASRDSYATRSKVSPKPFK
ncbi:hypothetical protein P8452_14674 [Trifolium repens]|nr:hypothetical protein P8452_14674 [Trifolium repens]